VALATHLENLDKPVGEFDIGQVKSGECVLVRGVTGVLLECDGHKISATYTNFS